MDALLYGYSDQSFRVYLHLTEYKALLSSYRFGPSNGARCEFHVLKWSLVPIIKGLVTPVTFATIVPVGKFYQARHKIDS